MGIQSAMYSGVSGLNINSQNMSIIGNNLANTNTLGYKGSRSVFSDLLSSNIVGSGGTSQVGRGVGLSIVDSVFSQGTMETTSSGTDVAIEGEGFFVLKDTGENTTYYSRAGSFRFDSQGYLVNPEGLVVQGKLFDPVNNDTLLPEDPKDIQVANVGLIEANPTTELTFNTNLNENSTEYGNGQMVTAALAADDITAITGLLINDVPVTSTAITAVDKVAAINDLSATTGVSAVLSGGIITLFANRGSNAEITLANASGSPNAVSSIGFTAGDQTLVDNTMTEPANLIEPNDKSSFNYSVSSSIYDSLGDSHLVSVYWRMVDNLTNTWDAAYTIDNGDPIALEQDLLVFDVKGQLETPREVSIAIPASTWANGADDSFIKLTFDCTQYDSASVVIGQEQNGFAAGELTKIAVNNDGVVQAAYSNGKKINIAQLVLAKFQNNGGLQLAGSNRYIASNEVGIIRVGPPGAELGKLFTNSLEQSNVDMGQEFVKMISTQRGFQANSKIITTVDEMLGELINLKR